MKNIYCSTFIFCMNNVVDFSRNDCCRFSGIIYESRFDKLSHFLLSIDNFLHFDDFKRSCLAAFMDIVNNHIAISV
jgi:hypothetical protein